MGFYMYFHWVSIHTVNTTKKPLLYILNFLKRSLTRAIGCVHTRLFLSFFSSKHRLIVGTRTNNHAKVVQTYTHNPVFQTHKKKNKNKKIQMEIFNFYSCKKNRYITWAYFIISYWFTAPFLCPVALFLSSYILLPVSPG